MARTPSCAAARPGRGAARRPRHPADRAVAHAGAHPPQLRLRARWPADQRAVGVPRRRRTRGGRHRRALPPFPDVSEGRLAKLRAAVVNMRALADVARTLGLGDHVLLGRGEETTGGRNKNSILADTMEAVIGACYLEVGLDDRADSSSASSTALHRRVRSEPGWTGRRACRRAPRVRARGPAYRILESGPDHAKSSPATVAVDAVRLRPRRRAQQEGGRAERGRPRVRRPQGAPERRGRGERRRRRLRLISPTLRSPSTTARPGEHDVPSSPRPRPSVAA